MKIIVISLLFLLVVSGCATSPSPVLLERTTGSQKTGENSYLATDARLRILSDTEISAFSRPGLISPKRIICTEPSPDVGIAVANSFSTGLSILGQGSGALTSESVQGLAQLVERTASIQVLRDKMYQTCLAYQNGAISGTTYTLLMSRLDDAIITLVFGETAAGRYGAKLASIGGKASGEAQSTLIGLPAKIGDLSTQVDSVKEANEKVNTKEKALTDKKKALVAAGSDEAAISNDPAVRQLQQDLSDAKKERDELLKTMQQAATTAVEGMAEISKLNSVGEISAKTSVEIAESLEDMQETFIQEDWAKLYINTCLVEMGAAQAEVSERFDEKLSLLKERQSIVESQLRYARETYQLLESQLGNTEVEIKDRSQQLKSNKEKSVRLNEISRLQKEKAKTESRMDSLLEQMSEIGKQLAEVKRDIAKLEAISVSAHDLLVTDYRQRFLEDKADANARVNYVQAVAKVRRTALAAHCQNHLPDFIRAARTDLTNYRTAKLQHDADTDRIRAEVSTRADTLKAMAAAIKACEESKSLDDAGKKVCVERSINAVPAVQGAKSK